MKNIPITFHTTNIKNFLASGGYFRVKKSDGFHDIAKHNKLLSTSS
jgi:hypothetical protein